ncbi:MAG: polymerase subunit delta [Verrucomicrobiota bacterium]|jgi:DNA polymerase-3 subunit delta'|nr:polymerase subunit delta [Verrucomicrobiota bacterium]MDK2963235.1 polymerase subunit delta [Verrucomicrobiota bacterium]
MPSSSQFSSAWQGIETSWQNAQLAHAYLLQGAPHGPALRFAEKLLNLIFNDHPQVQGRVHPDIVWIEPQSKSRQIGIDEVRNLIRQLSQTSFAGGWKAGVILSADRMTDQAANALLKTLEEPSSRSLLLLITDQPQSLLPTISSRCQRISLLDEDEEISRHWKDPLLDLLSELPPENAPEAGCFASRITGLLDELKKEFETEEADRLPADLSAKEAKALLDARSTARMIEARTEILRMMLLWQRDVLMLVLEQDEAVLHFAGKLAALKKQALCCTRADALQRLRAVEETARRFDRNLPAELVMNHFFGQFIQPRSTLTSACRART